MSRVLFAWECGAGLHHLANVEVLLRALDGEGHVLGVALRDLDNAPLFFAGLPLRYYQAPLMLGEPRTPVERSDAYVDVLRAAGLGEVSELQVRLSAWMGIFEAFRPDVLVCDHSPTALLASHAFRVRRLITGSGFCIPPLTQPLGVLPDFAPTVGAIESIRREEEELLAVVNRAVQPFGVLPLDALAALYARADAHLLQTLPELDPWGPRAGAIYLGTWPGPRAQQPAWPDGPERRVLVYLSPRDRAPGLVAALEKLDARVLALGPAPSGASAEPGGASIRYDARLVDLSAAATGCDLFVSHGSHSSVCQTLLRGVPQLIVPVYREQQLTARRVASLGAGITAPPETADFDATLARALEGADLRDGARRFAAAHADFDAAGSARRFRDLVRAAAPAPPAV